MNKEIEKAIIKSKNESKNSILKWWGENHYKVFRAVLFPITFIVFIKEKYNNIVRNRNEWNETKADKILQYYIPRKGKWYSEDNSLYFFDNGLGWEIKYVKFKDRTFWKINKREMRKYLIDKFKIEGFIKEVGECGNGRTELTFYLK